MIQPNLFFREKFISLMDSIGSMATTISISHDMKENLRNLGRAGDSYEDVIKRMYKLTKKQLLLQYLYDETDTLTIDEARAKLNE